MVGWLVAVVVGVVDVVAAAVVWRKKKNHNAPLNWTQKTTTHD